MGKPVEASGFIWRNRACAPDAVWSFPYWREEDRKMSEVEEGPFFLAKGPHSVRFQSAFEESASNSYCPRVANAAREYGCFRCAIPRGLGAHTMRRRDIFQFTPENAPCGKSVSPIAMGDQRRCLWNPQFFEKN